MDIDRDVSEPPVTQTRTSRKRPAPIIDDQELINTLAPNAARLKKRRLEEAAERRNRGESTPPPRPAPEPPKEKTPEPEPEPKTKPKRRTRKEIDAAASLIESHNAENVDRDYDEQDAIDYEGIDVDAVRSAIEVFELNVLSKPSRRQAVPADESERWNDKWNGRKDFKKFRRQGAAPRRREVGRVIVGLEEAKKKDYGIGEEYWGEDTSTAKQSQSKKKGKDKEKGKRKAANQSSDSEVGASGRNQRSRAQSDDDAIVIQSSEDEMEQDLVITFTKPRARKAQTTTQSTATTQSQSLNDKTAATKNIPATTRKRVAEKEVVSEKPVKRRQVQTRIGGGRGAAQESDDSDDMGFGFRRRK